MGLPVTASTATTAERAGSRALGAVQALPAAAVAVSALVLAWQGGGSVFSGDWLGYAVLSALVLAVVLAAGAAAVPARGVLAGTAALAALAAWAAISLEWSPLPSLARDEGLLTAWYAVAVAVGFTAARTARARLSAAGAIGLALGAFAVAVGLELRFGSSPLSRYDHGRLSYPITYANAQASLAAIGFWPSVVVASRRASPALLRGLAVGSAAACLGGALLPQSKGALLGLGVSTVLVLALAPSRLRLVVPAAVAVLGAAAAFRALTGPFRAYEPADSVAAIRTAGLALVLLAAGAAAAGLVYAAADRALEVTPRASRLLGRAALAAVVLAAIGGAAGFVAVAGNPFHEAKRAWTSFSRPPGDETGATHLLTLGSNRYDYWRVAAETFASHPIAGIGARGFGPEYLVERRSIEQPARAHSVAMDALAEQGIVGFALLASGLGLLLAAAAHAVRSGRVYAVAGLGAAVTWLAQALVDWTWTFPAVSIPALLLLGIAVARGGPALRPRLSLPLAGAAAAIALLVFAPPWLAWRLTARALETRDAGGLGWAERLDPVSTQPLLARAQLAGSPDEAVAALREAVRAEPRSFSTRFYLGVGELAAGDRRAARRDLRVALALKPGDGGVLAALRRAGGSTAPATGTDGAVG